MSKRTMIKLSASEDYIYLRTLSEEYRSPQGFTITDKELAEMEEKGYKVQEYVRESRKNNGEQKRILSLDEKPRPRIEFQSRRNLKAVTGEKLLRKKLGKALWRHFAWKGSRQITIYDDFEPYSFFFREQTPYGTGICGGIILHGWENMEKAYYGIHT